MTDYVQPKELRRHALSRERSPSGSRGLRLLLMSQREWPLLARVFEELPGGATCLFVSWRSGFYIAPLSSESFRNPARYTRCVWGFSS